MSVRKGQARLLEIATKLEKNSRLPKSERLFLSVALKQISEGEDAEKALDVKAKRGERKGTHAKVAKHGTVVFLGWIATAILPESEGGYGLSVSAACRRVSGMTYSHLRLSPESIRRYWDKHKNNYNPSFTIPAD